MEAGRRAGAVCLVGHDRIDLVKYPWDDRCLIDLSPDGSEFMTVDHGQADIAVHTYPDGEVRFALSVDAFGHDPDEIYVEWSGGYLSPDILIVSLVGETEHEPEWFRHYSVDTRSGRVRRPRGERLRHPAPRRRILAHCGFLRPPRPPVLNGQGIAG